MRKILIGVLIFILLLLGYFMIFNGIEVFGIDILSISQIKEKSENLDANLQKASTLTSVNQPNVVATLKESAKQLLIAKEEYNDKVLYSSSDDVKQASQGIQYEMEFLWTIIGRHATENKINLKFELKQSSTGSTDQYDLYFDVIGQYVSISEFVASLEDDTDLKFKIENFKLVPYGDDTQNLQATFVVKEIGIKIDRISNSTSTSTNDNTNTNNTNS